MAKIDKLIQKMIQSKIERALLVGDQPMQLFTPGRATTGTAIPKSQLDALILEITPSHLESKAAQNGERGFTYHSPQGACGVYIERTPNTLQVRVEPSFGTFQRSDEIAQWREEHPQDAIKIDAETTQSYLAERKAELWNLVQGGSAVISDDLSEAMGAIPFQKHTFAAIAHAADQEIAKCIQKTWGSKNVMTNGQHGKRIEKSQNRRQPLLPRPLFLIRFRLTLLALPLQRELTSATANSLRDF